MVEQQMELALPFEDFTGKMGSQAYAKQTYDRGNNIMLFEIPFYKLEIWEGYNVRTVFESIPELGESIFTHKQKTPFKVILVREGDRVLIVRGGRRKKAYEYLISEGKFDSQSEVPCEIVSTKETMEELLLDLHISNNLHHNLKPIDLSTIAFRLKFLCGSEKSNEEVARDLAVSRQTVDNLILISQATDYIKNEIRVGNMSFTDAVAFVRAQRKQSKDADKKEKESHETKASVNNEPEDLLSKDIEELADLEDRAEEFKQREAAKEARDLERLLDIANEVLVNKDSLIPHIGKRFAAPAYGIWEEDFVEPDSGEVVKIERQQLLLAKDQEVNETAIDLLIANNAKSVYIYKVHTSAPSVFSELPETEEKGKFDLDREEIQWCQNVIKNIDWLSVHAEKIEPAQTSKDFVQRCDWLQKDMELLRDWVHRNRKFNKLR